MQNPAPIPSFNPVTPPPRQRHGCLTAFLIAMLVAYAINSILSFISLFSPGNAGNPQAWVIVLTVIIGLSYIFCIILLFRWRKIGFWIFCSLAAVEIVLNLALGAWSLGATTRLLLFIPLVIAAILFGVLQIGGENKGWPQLE